MKLRANFPVLISVACFCFLADCSKHDVPPPCIPLNCQLATSSDGGTAYTFDQGKWTGMIQGSGANVVTAQIVYDDLGRINAVKWSTNSNRIDSFIYDINNRVIMKRMTYNLKDTGDFVTYSYNVHGQLLEKDDGTFQGSTQTVVETYSFEYPDDVTRNPAFASTTVHNAGGPLIAFTYDEKVNPYLTTFGRYDPSIPSNNVIRAQYGSANNVLNYSYNYNTNCYPLTQTVSGWYLTTPFTTTYSYSSCK